MKTNKQAINPVTLQTHKPQHLNVVIGRMHVGFVGKMDKLVQFALFDPANPTAEGIKGFTVIDEATFLNGIGHLFPAGELAEVHLRELGDSTEEPSAAYRKPNPLQCNEITLSQPEPCMLEVGQLSFDCRHGMVARLYGSYFGQDDRKWKPTETQRDKIDEMRDPFCMVDRDQAGVQYVSVSFNTLNEMVTQLPGVAATLASIWRETT